MLLAHGSAEFRIVVHRMMTTISFLEHEPSITAAANIEDG
jgi:hypothetical protein